MAAPPNMENVRRPIAGADKLVFVVMLCPIVMQMALRQPGHSCARAVISCRQPAWAVDGYTELSVLGGNGSGGSVASTICVARAGGKEMARVTFASRRIGLAVTIATAAHSARLHVSALAVWSLQSDFGPDRDCSVAQGAIVAAGPCAEANVVTTVANRKVSPTRARQNRSWSADIM